MQNCFKTKHGKTFVWPWKLHQACGILLALLFFLPTQVFADHTNAADSKFESTSVNAVEKTTNADDASQSGVSGKITDENGQPLPGVAIIVKGTTIGVVSDADGNYTLPNVSENAVLTFSFVGMITQEISRSGKTVINVSLKSDTFGIEEVVAPIR